MYPKEKTITLQLYNNQELEVEKFEGFRHEKRESYIDDDDLDSRKANDNPTQFYGIKQFAIDNTGKVNALCNLRPMDILLNNMNQNGVACYLKKWRSFLPYIYMRLISEKLQITDRVSFYMDIVLFEVGM